MATEKYKLQIMPRAAVDLDNIYEYISNELSAPVAAHNLMQKIEESFMLLRDFPEMCPMCEDEILRQKGYRKLVVNSYIALYTADKVAKAVTVMRVVHGRQEYSAFV
jgi:addiction module RelE/StbE family toxin